MSTTTFRRISTEMHFELTVSHFPLPHFQSPPQNQSSLNRNCTCMARRDRLMKNRTTNLVGTSDKLRTILGVYENLASDQFLRPHRCY